MSEPGAPHADPDVIVDGHEDLAFNVLADGRDYLTSARAVRAAEAGTGIEDVNGVCMLGLDDWLAARVAVVFATLLAIPRAYANAGEWSYATVEGAHQQALAQLDLYRRWAAGSSRITIVSDRGNLESVLTTWGEGEGVSDEIRRVGLVLLMESAEPIREPADVGFWAERGVRAVGPAWRANRYTGDTHDGGPLTPLGRELLRELAQHGIALDVTHMSNRACLEALDVFEGRVVASHAHSQRTVPRDRLLADAVIEGIAARDGIVGVMPLNWALRPGWKRGDGKRAVTLDALVDAVDAVCQLTGDARYVAIGSDFDGGQGSESAPAEIDTIADLPKLADALSRRGYGSDAIRGIMGGNWLRLLRAVLPR